MYKYNQVHFQKLLEVYDTDFHKLELSFGSQKDPNTFRKHLLTLDNKLLNERYKDHLQQKFDHKEISIKELKDYCRSNNETIRKLICIMAWGGMKEHQFMMCMTGSKLHKHKIEKTYQPKDRYKIKEYDDLTHICEKMNYTYKNKLDRSSIYNSFATLNLYQCGPAYFTKLMFFMSHLAEPCFIMDQWTARSINLLVDKQLITMRKSKNPSPSKEGNSGKIYNTFCQVIEDLSKKITEIKKPRTISPEDVEQLIFSRGGKKNKLEWRKYVETY